MADATPRGPVRGFTGGSGQPVPVVAAPSGPAAIAGLSGSSSSGYFTDQYGAPKLAVGDELWGLVGQAGSIGFGVWQTDISSVVAARAAQGFTALEIDVVPSQWNGVPSGSGVTWDGKPIFANGTTTTPGTPDAGLNNTYWQRVDYLLTVMASHGMTLFMNLGQSYDFDPGSGSPAQALAGLSDAQYQDYGFAVASRYAGTRNLIWIIEDDYFGFADNPPTQVVTGLRNAGDTRPLTVQNYAESTSRKDIYDNSTRNLGAALATYQWCYSYNVSYLAVEYAYQEASPIPVLRGDGIYYDHNTASDQLMRNLLWWALSSGSRGFFGGDNHQWPTLNMTDLTAGTWYTSTAGVATAAFAALPGWQKLIPDTGNVFITSGRGTRATSLVSGGSAVGYSGTTDSYVTGSVAADGSLGLIYLSHAGTIGIDQSKMRGGYTAHWMDPASGAMTSTTTGSSYNSVPLGNNSAGNPDWALVLAG